MTDAAANGAGHAARAQARPVPAAAATGRVRFAAPVAPRCPKTTPDRHNPGMYQRHGVSGWGLPYSDAGDPRRRRRQRAQVVIPGQPRSWRAHPSPPSPPHVRAAGAGTVSSGPRLVTYGSQHAKGLTRNSCFRENAAATRYNSTRRGRRAAILSAIIFQAAIGVNVFSVVPPTMQGNGGDLSKEPRLRHGQLPSARSGSLPEVPPIRWPTGARTSI